MTCLINVNVAVAYLQNAIANVAANNGGAMASTEQYRNLECKQNCKITANNNNHYNLAIAA